MFYKNRLQSPPHWATATFRPTGRRYLGNVGRLSESMVSPERWATYCSCCMVGRLEFQSPNGRATGGTLFHRSRPPTTTTTFCPHSAHREETGEEEKRRGEEEGEEKKGEKRRRRGRRGEGEEDRVGGGGEGGRRSGSYSIHLDPGIFLLCCIFRYRKFIPNQKFEDNQNQFNIKPFKF